MLGDANLLTGFSDGDTLADMDLDFPELVDDLLRSIGFSDHFIPLSNPSTNIITGLLFGGQVRVTIQTFVQRVTEQAMVTL